MTGVHKFAVWRAYAEKWQASALAPPDLVIEARDPEHAAKLYAERRAFENEIAVIVRDEGGTYFEIELVQSWEVDLYRPTTLEELCKS